MTTNTNAAQPGAVDLDKLEAIADTLDGRFQFSSADELRAMIAQARAASQAKPAGAPADPYDLPKWIDDLKGKDSTIDDLIEHVIYLRAQLGWAQPAGAGAPSIGDDPEFERLRAAYCTALNGDLKTYAAAKLALIAHIDAQLARQGAAQAQAEPVAWQCPFCNGDTGHAAGCPAPIQTELDDGLGIALCVVKSPGMSPVIKRPFGDHAAYIRELYQCNPNAEITLVRSWADSVGCQSAEDGREYLRMLDDGLPIPLTAPAQAGAAQAEALLRAVCLNARAVINRWDSPLWRQEVGTNDWINQLRKSVEAAEASSLPSLAAPTQPAAPNEDARDAARYRWLRDNCYDYEPAGEDDAFDHPSLHFESSGLDPYESGSLDDAIDAAIQSSSNNTGSEK